MNDILDCETKIFDWQDWQEMGMIGVRAGRCRMPGLAVAAVQFRASLLIGCPRSSRLLIGGGDRGG